MGMFRFPAWRDAVTLNGTRYLPIGDGVFEITSSADAAAALRQGALQDFGDAPMVQWLDSTGQALVSPAGASVPLTALTQAATSGLDLGFAQIATVAPPAGSTAITIGATHRTNYTASYSVSGLGHIVPCLNWFAHQTTATLALAIPTESKLDNETTGTITTAILHEAQIASNLGTITTAYAHRAQVSANSGTIGTFVGYYMPDLSAVSGITAKYCLNNRDPDAPIWSYGPIVDQSIYYASPNATGFTVTVTAHKQIALLTPAAGYAAGTINFPPKAGVLDGQTLELTTSQAVTAVTWGANGAAFVLNGPAGLTAGQTVRFRYFGAIDWWVRI